MGISHLYSIVIAQSTGVALYTHAESAVYYVYMYTYSSYMHYLIGFGYIMNYLHVTIGSVNMVI